MCKVGDIICIDNFVDNGTLISKHSFIVIDDEKGFIRGIPYDIIAIMMSSIKNDKQEFAKLNIPGNFYIDNKDTITNPHNNKNGFAKADQLYYFNKSKITYSNIGILQPDVLKELIDFINNSDFNLVSIEDNL